jgi:hypothetical protein
MTEQHQAAELVESDNGDDPATRSARRIAAEIAQALRGAGYSCVVQVARSPVVAPTHDGRPRGNLRLAQ